MSSKKENILLVMCGALSGVINGFFGGGGGMVIVPLLIAVCLFSVKNAHATAISVMLPICVVSAIIYAINGNFDFSVVLPVTLGFTGGGVIGALLLKKLNDKWIKYIFALLILAAGFKMLFS